MTDQPDQPSNPIPPEGCTCGSLYSVRGEHGKKDCPYRQDVNKTTPSVDKSETNVNSLQAQGGGEDELHQKIALVIEHARFNSVHFTATKEEARKNIEFETDQAMQAFAAEHARLLAGLKKRAVHYTADGLAADGLDPWAIPYAVIDAELAKYRKRP